MHKLLIKALAIFIITTNFSFAEQIKKITVTGNERISKETIILFSELSYKFVSYSVNIEILFIIMPIILIFIFYLYILLKSKFKLSYL